MNRGKLKFQFQKDQMDCGPACLSMIASSYGIHVSPDHLRELSNLSRDGVSVLGITEAAKTLGFETVSVRISIKDLVSNKTLLPCILYWNQNHFVVLKGISEGFLVKRRSFHLADPAYGHASFKEDDFRKAWLLDGLVGVAIFMEATDRAGKSVAPPKKKFVYRDFITIIHPHRRQLLAVFGLLLLGSLMTLAFPFLTQALIDKGVSGKNIGYVWLILLAQLSLFLGNIVVEAFRNWLTLIVGSRLSIQVLSEYFEKILQLPVRFFDTKLMGDFNQRIHDNDRIENFLTSQALLTFFSLITFTVFFGVLWYYDFYILLVYGALTLVSIIWSWYWVKKRASLDYLQFKQRANKQEAIYEIINGVVEIKLNGLERFKLANWKAIQKKLLSANISVLKLDQLQLSGFSFINQFKNIAVTFLAASYVIQDKMTLGALLGVSYIIGQMNAPINQLISFFRTSQDAKLSLDRLNEVRYEPTEEQPFLLSLSADSIEPEADVESGIRIKKLYFQYEGPKSAYVLNDVNIQIPKGKVTAVVGASGSGKTTLMKLLLKFYSPTSGSIRYNGNDLLKLSPSSIRSNCGVVMQDGFIFSDTIERNIATSDNVVDKEKLSYAARVANILPFIESLPLGYLTKIGAAGVGLSGGQKQRILIARAVYKDPHYLFFDEATSSLDAENEKIIHRNLQAFFCHKTVVIIAHRLSTVRSADKIIVLKCGSVVEYGNHQQLVDRKGEYYNLVKNQLELGNG